MLQDLNRFPSFYLLQPFVGYTLPRYIECILCNIKGGRLVRCLEGSRDRCEEDIPEEKAEEGGDNAAFTMEARVDVS